MIKLTEDIVPALPLLEAKPERVASKAAREFIHNHAHAKGNVY